MKKCPNEERVAKKSDLKKMRDKIQREDRKEDDRRYARKQSSQSSKRK